MRPAFDSARNLPYRELKYAKVSGVQNTAQGHDAISTAFDALTRDLVGSLPGGAGFAHPDLTKLRKIAAPTEKVPEILTLRSLSLHEGAAYLGDLVPLTNPHKPARILKRFGYGQAPQTTPDQLWDLALPCAGDGRLVGSFGPTILHQAKALWVVPTSLMPA